VLSVPYGQDKLEMNLIKLILTVCLVADPASCRTEQLLYESDGNLMRCMFLAPPEIAKWTVQHPLLSVVSWKCAPAGELKL
jgi:hypothetical protein